MLPAGKYKIKIDYVVKHKIATTGMKKELRVFDCHTKRCIHTNKAFMTADDISIERPAVIQLKAWKRIDLLKTAAVMKILKRKTTSNMQQTKENIEERPRAMSYPTKPTLGH